MATRYSGLRFHSPRFRPQSGRRSLKRQETILLVDDVPENLLVLSTALEEQGYEVCIAVGGVMALESVEDILPDLIVLDICMPHIDGYEVCDRLKTNPLTSPIPIIFVSAVHETASKVKAFSLGGADYITKPIQLEEALARIRHQLQLQSLQCRLEEHNIRLRREVKERKLVERQLARLSADLERQVKARTTELQLAYDLESTLKRITDRVRDSLDEHQILQTAVQELAQVTGATSCNASLYNCEQRTAEVRYEYTETMVSYHGRVLSMANAPEIYHQLLQCETFQFCPLEARLTQERRVILVCPLLTENGVMGDLWLINESAHAFSDLDVRLVQQVANQCAIALRQSRLYQASQAQVAELDKLNRLKDDFLSTITHELRTPIASIKVVADLLTLLVNSASHPPEPGAHGSTLETKLSQYAKILQQECDRELSLIQDLLDLQHLEAGTFTLTPAPVELTILVAYWLSTFESRLQTQSQTLVVDCPSLPLVVLDAESFRRILVELMNNACKYTPSGETITVALRREGTHLMLQVRNSGVEIDSEEYDRIFEKFYRIPSADPWKHGGTGLGLSLVKRLVSMLGGAIAVESGELGTCFTVTLPCRLAPNFQPKTLGD